jgi:hypothetical protein
MKYTGSVQNSQRTCIEIEKREEVIAQGQTKGINLILR